MSSKRLFLFGSVLLLLAAQGRANDALAETSATEEPATEEPATEEPATEEPAPVSSATSSQTGGADYTPETMPYRSVTQMYFRNGYDPTMNNMLHGPMQGFIANVNKRQMDESFETLGEISDQAVPALPEQVSTTTAENGANQEVEGATGATGEETPSGATEEAASGATGEEAASGATGEEATSGAAAGEVNGGDESNADSTVDEVPAQSNTPKNEPTTTGEVPYRQAPFRVVNDPANAGLSNLRNELEGLNKLLAQSALKTPIPATNPEDELALKELNAKAVDPDQKVLEQIQKSKTAATKIGDPFEIQTLHHISKQLRRVQDAVVRTATHQKQDLPPQTVVLMNLVKNVKTMRKQAEEQYQRQPLRTYAKDEKRLLKMEKLLGKMTELMNDRSLSPKQFNYLSAQYRDRLARLRDE